MRFRPRFSLQTLFILVAIASIPMGWIAWQVRVVAERRDIKAMLKERNLGVNGLPTFVPPDQEPSVPWYRKRLGDSTTAGVYLNSNAFSPSEIQNIKDVYPEIIFQIVDVPLTKSPVFSSSN
jgi:hypothetical protein